MTRVIERTNRRTDKATCLSRLLGPRESMDTIAEAIRRIQKHAGELARA